MYFTRMAKSPSYPFPPSRRLQTIQEISILSKYVQYNIFSCSRSRRRTRRLLKKKIYKKEKCYFSCKRNVRKFRILSPTWRMVRQLFSNKTNIIFTNTNHWTIFCHFLKINHIKLTRLSSNPISHTDRDYNKNMIQAREKILLRAKLLLSRHNVLTSLTTMAI